MSKQETKWKSGFIGVLLIILASVVGVFGVVYGYYHSKLSLMQYSDGTVSQTEPIDPTASEFQDGASEMEQLTSGLEQQDTVKAEGEIFGSEDVFNILLIGTDERSETFSNNARGDTCMLLSVNKKDGKLKLVSFERATAVPILAGQYKGQYDWLTHTFRYGGADLMMREIRECYKIDVTRYIRVNISTFMEGIDAVGGVTISLSQAESDYINYPQGTYAEDHIREMGIANQVQRVTPGENHLNGATAMLYARCRYIDSDWRRVERQRTVIQAAMNQVNHLDLLELNNLLNRVLPLVQTNLKESEITSLLMLAPKYVKSQTEEMTVPVSGTYGSMKGMGGRSMYAVNFNENAKILKKFLYGE